MNEQQEIKSYLMKTIGEEGCGTSCEEADIFHDDEGWKLFLPSFMGPWKLGDNMEEAMKTIRELSTQGFGLS